MSSAEHDPLVGSGLGFGSSGIGDPGAAPAADDATSSAEGAPPDSPGGPTGGEPAEGAPSPREVGGFGAAPPLGESGAAASQGEAGGFDGAPLPHEVGDAASAYASVMAATSEDADPAAVAPSLQDDGAPAAAPDPVVAGEPDHQQLLDADLLELEAKAQKADEYLELAQRTRADFENFRKRAARDANVAEARGIAKLAKGLLPAVDNLERALAAASAAPAPEGADATLAEGIKLVHADLLGALARVGIQPFSPAGEAFDPQCHEAMAQTPVPGTPPGTVVEVYQRGFRLGDTVLRPARVVVAG